MIALESTLLDATVFLFNVAALDSPEAVVRLAMLFFPFVLLIELPYYLVLVLALSRFYRWSTGRLKTLIRWMQPAPSSKR